jgi:hypothetical protein
MAEQRDYGRSRRLGICQITPGRPMAAQVGPTARPGAVLSTPLIF